MADYVDKVKVGNATKDIQDSGARTNEGTLANLTTTEKTNLVGAINEVNAAASALKSHLTLEQEYIPGTTQNINRTDGVVTSTTHVSNTDNTTVIRTDAYNNTDSTFTETRTLHETGEQLIIATNKTTKQTSVTYVAAA